MLSVVNLTKGTVSILVGVRISNIKIAILGDGSLLQPTEVIQLSLMDLTSFQIFVIGVSLFRL